MNKKPPFRVACSLVAIPDGHSKGLLPNARGQDQVFVVRQGERVFGYVNNCPHYDRGRMGWRKDEFLNGARDRIMCSVHGAIFRINDGVCELGPCLGQKLTPVPVKVVEGKVLIEFEPKATQKTDA